MSLKSDGMRAERILHRDPGGRRHGISPTVRFQLQISEPHEMSCIAAGAVNGSHQGKASALGIGYGAVQIHEASAFSKTGDAAIDRRPDTGKHFFIA